jgi:enoyl-CoA hydratase
MSDVRIRREGRAGRVTLERPGALNALTWEMVRAIDAALLEWRDDDAVALVLIDGVPGRAFCAGGDVTEIYHAVRRGDLALPRRFWAEEYAMNARIARYPKPVVSFLHGFTMGGGVGLGCHASHRVVGETSVVAMPECAIGLVPDVGGTRLLARAPGRLGEFLGVTGHRMFPSCAMFAGFADHFVPEDRWAALKADLVATGDASAVEAAAGQGPPSELLAELDEVNRHFSGTRLSDVWRGLAEVDAPFAERTRGEMAKGSPLAMACALELVHRLSPGADIEVALGMEYRYVWRAVEQGDFMEGIRAQIIEKDRTPAWSHPAIDAVTAAEVTEMLTSLGEDALRLEAGT